MKTNLRICFFVMVIVVLLVPVSIAYATSPNSAVHFRLAADEGWVDSGFYIEAGQQITITAHGQAITAPINVFDSGSVSGPDGQVNICPNYDDAPPCAMDLAPYGALVGKIGEQGVPFLIGSDFEFAASSSGNLFVAVNDLLPYYEDNHGNYMIFFNK